MTLADPNVYQLNYPSISSLEAPSASPPADESRRRVASKMRGEEEGKSFGLKEEWAQMSTFTQNGGLMMKD